MAEDGDSFIAESQNQEGEDEMHEVRGDVADLQRVQRADEDIDAW